MSPKLLTFFVFCFAVLTVISSIVENQQGFATTSLNGSISETDTTITVSSTADFLGLDVLWIGNEKISYTGKTSTTFTGATRGYGGTTASSHSSGAKVYNEASGILNQLIGFNVAQSSSTVGTFSTVVQAGLALIRAIPRLIMWDYSFLTGDLALIKYLILYPLSTGLVIGLIILFIGAIQGIFRL